MVLCYSTREGRSHAIQRHDLSGFDSAYDLPERFLVKPTIRIYLIACVPVRVAVPERNV